MKAAPFDYIRVSSVDEAVGALHEAGGDARVLSGGQNLVPMLNMRLVQPSVVVDVNDIDELSGIEMTDGVLRVGATVRYSELEHSSTVQQHAPLLRDAVRYVGDRLVRNRGTIGGSLAQADPSGEMPMAALALGATVGVRGPAGGREIPASALFLGPYETALQPDELIVDVRFPTRPGAQHVVLEQARRHNDYAIVATAVTGEPQPDGTWRRLRIALAAVAGTAVLAEAAATMLEGERLDDESIRTAATAALDVAEPASDIRASADYRRHLVPVYVERALRLLADRRRGAA